MQNLMIRKINFETLKRLAVKSTAAKHGVITSGLRPTRGLSLWLSEIANKGSKTFIQ